jgi:transcriptional regulator with XRE-family HTH domain
MSQTDLADALDLTFQQVQKYERGANRISASKLYEAAQAVKVPIEYFFRGLDEQNVLEASTSENTVNAFLLTSEGLDLAQTFPRIKSAKLKRRILELVQTVAHDDDHR